MLGTDERTIINDYKKAIKSYYRNKHVVDLDEWLPKKLDNFIIRLDQVLPEIGLVVPPYKQSRFMILYILSGGGIKKIGTITIDIKERTLIAIPAFTIHSANYGEDVKGYLLSFNLDFYLQDRFPNHHLAKMHLFAPYMTSFTYTDQKEEALLTSIFEMIFEENTHDRKNKEVLIALKILELIIHCERLLKCESKQQKKIVIPLVIKYMQLINEHYKTYHNTDYYAKKLHIHPNQLNANTKKYLGRTAKSTIDAMLMKESENLLHQTALSVKELAYELGFQSASHFSRFFKRHTGISPAAYRQQAFENVTN